MKQILFLFCLSLAACSRTEQPDKKMDLQADLAKILAPQNLKAIFLSNRQVDLALLSIKYKLTASVTEGIAWDFHEKFDMRPFDPKHVEAVIDGKLDQYLKLQGKGNDIPVTIHELSLKYSVPEETIAALLWDFRVAGVVNRNGN